MSVSLDIQTVYQSRSMILKPVTMIAVTVSIIAIMMIFKVTSMVTILNHGYDLAEIKRSNIQIQNEIKELELQKSILMRSERMKAVSKDLGLSQISYQQIVRISN